ncbi:MAG: DUF2073 domain-containing protein [Euryarchaeota archaeon]|nr:DUF2073 domain-containing protein [Euryarchaeota archaeon]
MSEIILQIISKELLKSLGNNKLDYIIDRILEGKVLLLEECLSPEEQLLLIRKAMEKVDVEKFKGIEMAFYPEEPKKSGFLAKILKRKSSRVMLVGPSNLISEVRRKGDTIETIIKVIS